MATVINLDNMRVSKKIVNAPFGPDQYKRKK